MLLLLIYFDPGEEDKWTRLQHFCFYCKWFNAATNCCCCYCWNARPYHKINHECIGYFVLGRIKSLHKEKFTHFFYSLRYQFSSRVALSVFLFNNIQYLDERNFGFLHNFFSNPFLSKLGTDSTHSHFYRPLLFSELTFNTSSCVCQFFPSLFFFEKRFVVWIIIDTFHLEVRALQLRQKEGERLG